MMNPVLLGALIGAGAGVLQNASGKQESRQKRKLAAETMRLSPWTGMQPDMNFQEPSLIGNMLQGGLTGASMGGLGRQAGLWGQVDSTAREAAPNVTQPITPVTPIKTSQISPWELIVLQQQGLV